METLDKAIEALAADADASKRKTRKLVALNPAMAAVAEIEAILESLSDADAVRVLDWVNDSYDSVRTFTRGA